jgi:exonuclease SbcD
LRILHSSDWHLGATAGNVSRGEEQRRFLDWLAAAAALHEAELLIVAGDVFDHANPPAESLRDYYRFLLRLASGPVRQVVVVAGNHDSGARLEAPAEVLDSLDVRVVGRIDGDGARERMLCPVPAASGDGVAAAVLAVPYVHEYRLGVRCGGEPAAVRAQFVEAFSLLYRELADEAASRWPGVPLIATGHLSAGAFSDGDFPRPIHQVGSVGALPAEVFDPRIGYVALGHIHRCMHVEGSAAWYSGSPVPMNLREAATARRVLRADFDASGVSVTALEVPRFRELVEIAGPLSTVRDALASLRWDEPLPPLLWVRAQEASYRPELASVVQQALDDAFGGRGAHQRPLLVESRQERPENPCAAGLSGDGHGGAPDLPSLRELDPASVFARLCEQEGEPLDDALRGAFLSLLSLEEPE